ncbi:hypothetical protein V492_04406 [Pseudogymnoascus sp. VKM F-4246]|nr:hypothetical protein V492_04406 [Pseudogymnoascus sp. VKM F-4246]
MIREHILKEAIGRPCVRPQAGEASCGGYEPRGHESLERGHMLRQRPKSSGGRPQSGYMPAGPLWEKPKAERAKAGPPSGKAAGKRGPERSESSGGGPASYKPAGPPWEKLQPEKGQSGRTTGSGKAASWKKEG